MCGATHFYRQQDFSFSSVLTNENSIYLVYCEANSLHLSINCSIAVSMLIRTTTIAVLLLVVILLPLFAVNPERGYKAKPDKYGIEFRESGIKTPDAARINTWTFEPQNAAKIGTTIILAGGDAGNMSYLITYADGLRKQGFRVVTFDYRGFGESSDFSTSREVLYYDEFTIDLQSVIGSVKRLYPTDKIGVLGFSMGTIIAFQSAKPSLDFIAADSPVASVRQTVERWSAKGKTLRYPSSGKSLEQTIQGITIPIIVFAGKTDTFTPLDEAKSIVKGYEAKRRLVEYLGGHLEGWKLGETYFSTLKNFVQQYCSK